MSLDNWKKAQEAFEKFIANKPNNADTLKSYYDSDIEMAYHRGYSDGRSQIIAESQAILDSVKDSSPQTEIKKG